MNEFKSGSSASGDEGVDSEVEICFWTKIKDARLNKVPEGTFIIQKNSTRAELSRLLNSLLEIENVVFDFLIEDEFLRTTISEYMKLNNKTSESRLKIEYVLTLNKPSLDSIDKNNDWIRSICCSIGTDNPMVVSGSYDGVVRFYDVFSHISSKDNIKHLRQDKEDLENLGEYGNGPVFELNISDLLTNKDTSVLKVHSQQLDNSVYSKVWVSTMNGCIVGVDYSSSNSIDKDKRVVVKNIVKKASFYPIEALCTFGRCENIVSAGDACGNISIFSEEINSNTESGFNTYSDKKSDNNYGLDENKSSLDYVDRLENSTRLSILSKSKPHLSNVTDLMASGEYLLSASLDGNIKVTNIYTGESVCGWNSKFPIFSISPQHSSFGGVICTSHDDGKVRIWDIRCGNTTQMILNTPKGVDHNNNFDRNTRLVHRTRILAHREVVPSAQWNPFNDFMIGSVSHDRDIKILDIRSPNMPLQIARTESKLLTLCWTNDRTLYTGGSSGELIACIF